MKTLEVDASALEYYIMTTALRIVTWVSENKTAAGYRIAPADVLTTVKMQNVTAPDVTEENVLAYFQAHPEYFTQKDGSYILVAETGSPEHIAIGTAFSALVAKAEKNS